MGKSTINCHSQLVYQRVLVHELIAVVTTRMLIPVPLEAPGKGWNEMAQAWSFLTAGNSRRGNVVSKTFVIRYVGCISYLLVKAWFFAVWHLNIWLVASSVFQLQFTFMGWCSQLTVWWLNRQPDPQVFSNPFMQLLKFSKFMIIMR